MRLNLLTGLMLGTLGMLCLGHSALASANDTKSATLVKEITYRLKVGADEFEFRDYDSDAGFQVIEENSKVYIQIKGSDRRYQVGTFDLPVDTSNPEVPVYTSSTPVNVRVLENKETKKFEMNMCTHMGCFPFPHFEGTLRTLVEFQTMDGSTMCLNHKALENAPILLLGSCPR